MLTVNAHLITSIPISLIQTTVRPIMWVQEVIDWIFSQKSTRIKNSPKRIGTIASNTQHLLKERSINWLKKARNKVLKNVLDLVKMKKSKVLWAEQELQELLASQKRLLMELLPRKDYPPFLLIPLWLTLNNTKINHQQSSDLVRESTQSFTCPLVRWCIKISLLQVSRTTQTQRQSRLTQQSSFRLQLCTQVWGT